MRITNDSDVSLALAVWLLHDEYDYISDENYISVTRLMRPLRHIVLPGRIPTQDRQVDVTDFIARALGHSVHDSIEKAWKKGYAVNLAKLGYPDSIISRVRINPKPEEVAADDSIIPVYIEQRIICDFEGWKIGGKFDMVTEGIVQDNKSTSAFTWVYGTRDDEHILQGSLYRWVDSFSPNPVITEDFMRINYIFTDWSKMSARTNPKYPQRRVEAKELKLLSLKETEKFVREKLAQIQQFWKTPEIQIPHCTDEELWRPAPQFKYYADASKTDGRATKNFDTLAEANEHLASKGKGVVLTASSNPKRCEYCDAFDACTQKDQWFQ